MQLKSLSTKNFLALGFIFLFCILIIFGCNGDKNMPTSQTSNPGLEKEIVITGDGITKEGRMTLKKVMELPDAQFEHVYSIINNWPAQKELVARGVKVTALLEAAGMTSEAKCITIKGEDGYESSFTRQQLLETRRYYFPHVKEGDPAQAEPVEPIIAFEYMENSNRLSEARADSLCFIMPQANVYEQTYHTFVKDIKEITVSKEDPGKWETATVFPVAGKIARGDTVKLQHNKLGKVKLYYTLDGSIPTEKSMLYNPSTYQPELNKPIVINQDTIIKVLVKGFGKYDSDVAEYHYQVK
ncbi:MAG: FN3 associated domain-containing protein [Syntrophomonas sp.]